MTSQPRLDLIHTSPVVTTALRHALRSGPAPVRVQTAVHSWSDFQTEWDFAGDVVVVDAMLDDHVPLPLKVRALCRLGSAPIVLGPGPGADTPFARRCAHEGAIAWIEPAHGLAETARIIRLAALGAPPPSARLSTGPPPVAALTDREIQVLVLWAGTRGHSPADLGRVLALRTESIRSHLDRGRARYRAAGVPTPHRLALRAALIEDGWLLDPDVWAEAGRL